MSVVADAGLDADGEAIGVIPKALVERKISHTGLTDVRVVGSMHERKALMCGLSETFVALPGGSGILEEFFEVQTWVQLGEHENPAVCSTSVATTTRCSPTSTTWSQRAF